LEGVMLTLPACNPQNFHLCAGSNWQLLTEVFPLFFLIFPAAGDAALEHAEGD